MSHLIQQGDGFFFEGFSLLGESSLKITLNDIGTHFFGLNFLVLSAATSVSIDRARVAGGFDALPQLAEKTNDLTTVTIR